MLYKYLLPLLRLRGLDYNFPLQKYCFFLNYANIFALFYKKSCTFAFFIVFLPHNLNNIPEVMLLVKFVVGV